MSGIGWDGAPGAVLDAALDGVFDLRLTQLGCVGFLVLMAEVENGRPAWLGVMARVHGHLPAADGYIDLDDVGVDVLAN